MLFRVNSESIELSKDSAGACFPSLARTVILWEPGMALVLFQLQEAE